MDLVKSVSFENMVNQREGMVELLAEAKALFDQATRIGLELGLRGVPTVLTNSRVSDINMSDSDYIDRVSAAIDAKVWDKLMKESGLRTFMNDKARQEWDRQIHEERTPPLTVENMVNTFRNLYDARGRMFEEGVIDVFKSLSWDYKTNNPCRFGKRIIMNYLGNPCWHIDYRAANKLDDLERVFSVIDGRCEADHRDGWYTRMANHQCEASSDYIKVRRFKKGSGHITFLRSDLVEKMNLIIAKHYPGALPSRT